MMDTMDTHAKYLEVLREELIPAQGCTEPIAIAFAGALATKVLGTFPERLTVACSGNMLSHESEKRAPDLEIYIPPGQRLGKVVFELEGVCKGMS